ncbi:MAG: TonB-dependent siderophore receptor [Gemmatimonadetes bacterium]|nr:TonB-dependent siderophore receptor [Gemmatimonadota bacterium]
MKVRATRATAYALRSTRSASRISTKLVDLPMSVSVVTRGQLDDRGVLSMADVVRYLPAVTMGQGEGHRDQPTTRGISSTADLYVDGVRDDAQYLRDLYNVERVEALRGPNALAFGRGGGGGVLNRVMRQADFAPHRAFVLESGTFDQARGTLDLGRAAGPRAAVRLNAMSESANSFRDIARRRTGVNPTAALVVAGGVVHASVERFEDRRTVDRGLPSFNGQPAPVDQQTFYGDRDVNRARAVVDHARLEYERGSEATGQLRSVLAWSQYDKMYQNEVPGAMNAAGTSVALSAYRNQTNRHNLFSQTDLTWRARTGVLRHVMLGGAEFGAQSTSNFRETGYFGTATSITVPSSGGAAPMPVSWRQSATDADNHARVRVAAAYLQHQASVGEAWQTTLGVRVERMALSFDNLRNGQHLERTDVMVTPRAGLVFKPRATMSLYASLATSALPSAGDQFSSLTATSSTLHPERFETRESGIKWTPTPNLLVSGAFFVLTRSGSTAPDPVRPGIVVQTGRQESRGVELEAQGEVMPGWQLTGAYSVQRARIVSRTSAAHAGATVPLVPAQSFSLWNRVQVGPRLAAALGVVRQERMYAAIDNKVMLPSFTRLDGALFVPMGQRLLLQVNVENVANVRYVASANGNNNLQPGTPRSLRASLTVR